MTSEHRMRDRFNAYCPALREVLAERKREDAERRLAWLHSPASNNVDGYEWGVYRVKWVNGKAAEVWQTNADFSDLDSAIAAAESLDRKDGGA